MPNPPPGYEWDEAKATRNLATHGVSFAAAEHFELTTAIELDGSDYESDYESEEIRTALLGKIGKQIHVFVFTRRAGRVRVISLRRATSKERRFYIEAKGY